jgi:hypothetical protein
MEDDMHKMLLALLISVFVIPTEGFAQTQPTNEGRAETVRVPALQLPAGLMRESVDRDVRLAALPLALGQSGPRQHSWAGRHPVLCGTLVGLGIGLGVEAAVIPGASGGGEPHGYYVPMFGGLGAGIGALVGVIVSVTRR